MGAITQEADPDSFENWEKLVRACEGLEGGLNRNSSPQALATLRDTYDRFLLKFPLLFGYWKKYADLEFNISGPESAEMVRITDTRPSSQVLMCLAGLRKGMR
jgi:pre-mRNA-processing factor 39